MSGEYQGWFKASDGHTITVNVLNGATIKIAKFNDDSEQVAPTVELTGADAHRILAAKPSVERQAWLIDNGLTIAPPDVEKFAEPLRNALARLEANRD